MEYGLVYVILAVVFGLFMAWGVGANDVANAMGTSVGSKAVTLRNAIIIAIIFEAAGAILAGGEVTSTIRGKIIDSSMLVDQPDLLIYGMLASLLAAGTWLLIATYYGWPVSTTHSIIGAIVGFAAVTLGVDTIHWGEVFDIFLSWVVTPLIAGVIAYLLFMSVQYLILEHDHPLQQAKRYVPFYIFIVSMVICLVTVGKGLVHVEITISFWQTVLVSTVLSILFSIVGIWALYKMHIEELSTKKIHFAKVEKVFGVLMVFTACAMAFAHGSNDVANAIGPVAAIVSIVENNGQILSQSAVPAWILLLGGGGIVLGVVTYGHRVIATIGTNITQLTPSRGFAAQLATAATVVTASGMGLPISTTQTLVGAVLGVGFARGIAALNIGVVGNILMSWVITLPAGAVLAIVYFYIIQFFFSF